MASRNTFEANLGIWMGETVDRDQLAALVSTIEMKNFHKAAGGKVMTCEKFSDLLESSQIRNSPTTSYCFEVRM